MSASGAGRGLSLRSVGALTAAFGGLLVAFSGLSRLAGALEGSPWTAFGVGTLVVAGSVALLAGGGSDG